MSGYLLLNARQARARASEDARSGVTPISSFLRMSALPTFATASEIA